MPDNPMIAYLIGAVAALSFWLSLQETMLMQFDVWHGQPFTAHFVASFVWCIAGAGFGLTTIRLVVLHD